MKRIICVVALTLAPGANAYAQEGWIDLLAKVDLTGNTVNWTRGDKSLRVKAAPGARLALPYHPPAAYDFRVRFTRESGVHSIALIFVHGGKQATFEIDAWGEHLAGIQRIDGQSLRDNPTRVEGQQLENGRTYTALLRVRPDRVEAWLDGKKLTEHVSGGGDLSLLDVWRLPDSNALGIGAYDSGATFHAIEVKPAEVEAKAQASTQPAPPPPEANVSSSGDKNSGDFRGRGRVLLVIANDGFFYREYADPLDEFRKAGIAVDVAAGRKARCVPHPNSGQQGEGTVMPDMAIADADPARYDALVFSGGWGSSMYQYAFEGRYDYAPYNGDTAMKQHANRLINAMAKDDKYIAGICHGVSVLAWSRVNGKSLLRGKRVAAPAIGGPAGIYEGRHQQPPSRWNAQANGAILTDPGSIGDPSTSRDDVAIDGKILTAEDDHAARLLGKVLAEKLGQQNAAIPGAVPEATALPK